MRRTTDTPTDVELKPQRIAESPTPATPVRVMHVVYELRFGGMELGVAKLVNAFDRRRITSSICSCRPATSAKARLASDVRLHELNRRDGNDPMIVGRLAALFRRERPHVVHTHAWGTLCEGVLAARLARVPIIVHGEHGTMSTHPRNLLVQRWVWSRVDQVLSVSSRLAERMAREVSFPLERIRTIRNGVDLTRFQRANRAAARASLGLDDAAFVVGTVGRLVPVKNQALLVEALTLLAARSVCMTALVAGEGPLREDLQQRVNAAGLASRVRLLGERSDVEQVMAALDVFTLTSTSEGMSNTIQEAMAVGVPVVATHVGGADELVEDGLTGVLVPSENATALADALEGLFRDPARRARFGDAGRERAEREFTLARMVREYEDLYLRLAAKKLVS